MNSLSSRSSLKGVMGTPLASYAPKEKTALSTIIMSLRSRFLNTRKSLMYTLSVVLIQLSRYTRCYISFRSGSMWSKITSAYHLCEAVNTITSKCWFTISKHSLVKGLTLKPAFRTLPDYNLISKCTSGCLRGFSCRTQCANVSSRSKIIVFFTLGLVNGSSIILLSISWGSIGGMFCKKLIDWKMWMVNSRNTGPFSSLCSSADSLSICLCICFFFALLS